MMVDPDFWIAVIGPWIHLGYHTSKGKVTLRDTGVSPGDLGARLVWTDGRGYDFELFDRATRKVRCALLITDAKPPPGILRTEAGQ